MEQLYVNWSVGCGSVGCDRDGNRGVVDADIGYSSI